MTTITISASSRENAYLAADGTFAATLVSVVEKGQDGLRSEGARPFDPRPDDDGKVGKPYFLFEWAFAIEGAPPDACMVWVASNSGATGAKSKTYGIIAALIGREPKLGGTLDVERHLVGRQALLTVRRNAEGFMRVENVGAMPSQPVAAAPAVASPPSQPVGALRQQVADDEIPF